MVPLAARAAPAPLLIRDDLLRRFRESASADDARRFECLRTSEDPADRDRALEMLLFPLSDHDVFGLGVTAVIHPQGRDWSIAWTEDHGPGHEAVRRVLFPVCGVGGGSTGLGFCGWYVRREDFFRARRALLADPEVVRLRVNVVSPAIAPK